MNKVIELIVGPGTGRKTCLGGTVDDIHLRQSYLNPVYKNLQKIGVPYEKSSKYTRKWTF